MLHRFRKKSLRMGSILLFFFLQNVLVFGLIFWLLTWLTEWFFQKKNHVSKGQLYECGFRAISDINIQINLNFSMVCVFLILYDVEFTFLFPLLFNSAFADAGAFYIFFSFIFFILISLVYDLNQHSLGLSI
jgi:NADH:ubiquinone oxidoreductase subunit 3 (subunit A)